MYLSGDQAQKENEKKIVETCEHGHQEKWGEGEGIDRQIDRQIGR